ncbi:MAG TPA: TerB family tellurite resistance protein [Phycisphaerales bacterium]|nr:TerB family tellurite resistance protein [Phycisphaerales bacterium]HMP38673.1 TerB family tellurite resistance protein [Phycisphaerales bacterium]
MSVPHERSPRSQSASDRGSLPPPEQSSTIEAASDQPAIGAIAAICVMAAMADGSTADAERTRLREVFDGLAPGESSRTVAAAHGRVLLGTTTLAEEVARLRTPELRALAYEMAVAICDADGAHVASEGAFLERLRTALEIAPSAAAATLREADELADFGLDDPVDSGGRPTAHVGGHSGPGAARPRSSAHHRTPALDLPGIAGGSAAGAAQRTAGGRSIQGDPAARDSSPAPEADLDGMIRRYAILTGSLELLPQSLATMAIVPLQMKMVYRIGKAHGVTLDRGHISEFIGVVGVGMTSQVAERFARNLVGGLSKRLLGRLGGSLARVTTGTALSFATTYALGQVARQYYAGGRRLSAVDLRALFSRELEQGKALSATHRGAIEEGVRSINPAQLAELVRSL